MFIYSFIASVTALNNPSPYIEGTDVVNGQFNPAYQSAAGPANSKLYFVFLLSWDDFADNCVVVVHLFFTCLCTDLCGIINMMAILYEYKIEA